MHEPIFVAVVVQILVTAIWWPVLWPIGQERVTWNELFFCPISADPVRKRKGRYPSGLV